jgi:regulator of protease activity HflC (stomatin/prohibitin superfamily)
MSPGTDTQPGASNGGRVRKWFAERRTGLLTYFLGVAIFIVLAWPFATVTIRSGEVGVKYSPLFGGTVIGKTYSEGLHFLFPWDSMALYDTRLQHDDIDIPVLSRGGLSVDMKVSVYYEPIVERLSELHRDIGPDYQNMLIRPIVASAIRNTVGSYWPEDLYTTAPLKLQDELMVQAVEQMARKPVIIDSIVVRGISLPDQVNQAIDLKFSAEQEYLRYKYVLLKAGEQLKESYIRAESIRMFQNIVNGGMTDAYLRWAGVEATKALASSDNAKFVIMGGRDGLPVILNMDSQGATKAADKKGGSSLGDLKTVPSHDNKNAKPQAEGNGLFSSPDWQELKSRYENIQDAVRKFEPLAKSTGVNTADDAAKTQPSQESK